MWFVEILMTPVVVTLIFSPHHSAAFKLKYICKAFHAGWGQDNGCQWMTNHLPPKAMADQKCGLLDRFLLLVYSGISPVQPSVPFSILGYPVSGSYVLKCNYQHLSMSPPVLVRSFKWWCNARSASMPLQALAGERCDQCHTARWKELCAYWHHPLRCDTTLLSRQHP